MIELLIADGAPAPKGPYSHAAASGDLVVVTAQTGTDPVTGLLRSGAEPQARQAVANLLAVLRAAGSAPEAVLRLGIALLDLTLLPVLNAAIGEALGAHRPPRATAQVVALPGGAALAIDALAARTRPMEA